MKNPCFGRLTAATAFVLAVVAPSQAANIVSGTLDRPEGTRYYLRAHPAQPTSGKRPLVILLHGHGASAAVAFGRDSRVNDPAAAWLDIADRDGVLVLAPDGWKGSDGKSGWNDCRADATSNPRT
ncbi:MAG TPA: hypothetical protein VIT92_05895, partial [Burkholderiaceae bacterium]